MMSGERGVFECSGQEHVLCKHWEIKLPLLCIEGTAYSKWAPSPPTTAINFTHQSAGPTNLFRLKSDFGVIRVRVIRLIMVGVIRVRVIRVWDIRGWIVRARVIGVVVYQGLLHH